MSCGWPWAGENMRGVGRLKDILRRCYDTFQDWQAERLLPHLLNRETRRLDEILSKEGTPRIILVKQDICEDLYCCSRNAIPREIIGSTMLRTGPVALFSRFGAQFCIVNTVGDPECAIWQERACDLNWAPLEFFESYRDRIPGRDYGQCRFASQVETVDWTQYDIVISVDVAVPQRITRQCPETTWCYYVREIKTPSYSRSLFKCLSGQDLVLNHCFRLRRPSNLAFHVVEFPYHLQYTGCFHELFGGSCHSERSGIFIDHHTRVKLDPAVLNRLETFGPVATTLNDPSTAGARGQTLPHRRTMDLDLRDRLLHSKYFLITPPGQRNPFGTSAVEAIAAGCLAIGSAEYMKTHGFLFNRFTSARCSADAVGVISRLEGDKEHYQRELERQRTMIDYLCFVRPMLELLEKSRRVRSRPRRNQTCN